MHRVLVLGLKTFYWYQLAAQLQQDSEGRSLIFAFAWVILVSAVSRQLFWQRTFYIQVSPSTRAESPHLNEMCDKLTQPESACSLLQKCRLVVFRCLSRCM